MKNKARGRDIFIAFVTAVVVAIVYLVLVRHFLPTPILLNDQIMFREISSGHYTGVPNGRIVYSMYIYGEILAILYRVAGSVQWYDAFAYAVLPLCAFLFSFFISLRTKNKIFKIIWPFLFLMSYYICTTYYYTQNEYTVNAGILAAAGLLCFSANLFAEKNGLCSFLSIFALLTSLLLRVNIFIMVIPFIVLLAVKGFILKRNRDGILRFAAIMMGGIILCFAMETIANRGVQWQEYRNYNEARTAIFDYEGLPDDEETIQKCAEIGVAAVEYKGLQEEFGLVKSVDADELSEVAKITGLSFTQRLKTSDYRTLLYLWIQKMKDYLKQPIGLLGFSVFGLTFLLELLNTKEKFIKRFANTFWGILGVGYFVAFSFYFVFIGRFPGRVWLGLGFMMAAYYIALFIEETTRINEEKRKLAFILQSIYATVMIAFCIAMFGRNTKIAIDNWFWRQNYMEISSEIRDLCNGSPDKLFYVSKRIAPSQAAYLNDENYRIPENFLTEVYWTTNSPVHSARLANHGIVNTIDAIMELDNIYYVAYADDDLSWLTELTGFYGHAVTLTPDSSYESKNGTVIIYHIEN